MPILRIHLLGDFLLLAGDAVVATVTIPRVQSLLAYLVLHRAAPQSRSHLAFLLWPDSTEAQAHTNLRQLLYHLRQSLPDVDQFLHVDKQSLQWVPGQKEGSWTLDVLAFERTLARAEEAEKAGDAAGLRAALVEVLRLYRGDLLPACYEGWIAPERDRLRALFIGADERLIGLLEEERDYAGAIAAAHRLLRHDALHEGAYCQLMRLHMLRDERAAALRVYHSCVTALERELGMEPSEVTQEIYQSCVRDASVRQERPATKERASEGWASRPATTPLFGRADEWRTLQMAWRKAASGQSHFVVLAGEAGIGKTRLMEEMEVWASRQNIAVASTRCYATPAYRAFAPVVSWLRSDAIRAGIETLDPIGLTEIARLVPEVLSTRPELARPAAMTEGWQRQQFCEVLARAVLSARQPLLLLIDDLHWSDSETLDWLHFLLHFDRAARFLVIGTIRAGEMQSGHPYMAPLRGLQRDNLVTEVLPGALTVEETASLAEHIVGHALEVGDRSAIYVETEGNPLFVVEMTRAGMAERRAIEQDADAKKPRPLLTQAGSSLPSVIQSVLEARLAPLSSLAREVANVAAVIGREFSFSLLVRASGESEESVVQGLDELWQRRIVREQGRDVADSYDFSHGKLRDQVYESLSRAQRRLLHKRVAEALKVGREEEWEGVSEQIGVHYARAGLSELAVLMYQRAGEVARRFYANGEAKRVLMLAAEIIDLVLEEDAQWEMQVQVYEAIGEVSAELGDYEKAIWWYQNGLECVPEQARLAQARLQRKVGNAWNQAGSNNPFDVMHENARQAFGEAERILTLIEDPSDPQWRQEWIELQFAQIWPLRGSVDDMTVAIEKARPMIEQYGTGEQRGFFSYVVAMRNLIRDRFVIAERALGGWRAALVAARQRGEKSQIGGVQFSLGVALLWAGELDEAEEHLREALRMGEEIGRAWLRARSLTFLPFVFRMRGQEELVREMLERAQTMGVINNNGMLLGHRAWIAWREGDLDEAEAYGKRSLDEKNRQRMELNSFQWVGRWPLIGVALSRGKVEEAMGHVRALLDARQQQPPEVLRELLGAALSACEADKKEEAHAFLQRSVPLARGGGYL
jgi:DNA-binding SARP family transcriptional activator/tetratricopeptide (TPR) repeat protein